MSKSSFRGGRWEIAKIIMAMLCLILMVYQIISGYDMIKTNNNLPPYFTQSQFETLESNQQIRGQVTDVAAEFTGDEATNETDLRYYIVLTEHDKIMILRTKSSDAINTEILKLREGEIDSFEFRGYVRPLTERNTAALNIYLVSTAFLKKRGISGGTHDAMLGQLIDITAADSTISEKAINATFIGAVLAFLMSLLLLRKTFKNVVISIMLRKHPEREKQLLNRDDYIFENEGLYTGNDEQGSDFFVNTEYNVRNEGDTKEAPDELMTHMVAEGDLFYEGGLNEEGNFYVDSEKDPNKDVDYYDPDNLTKRY